MAIAITCPGCHARFKVSDKFAGKKGPCPKCKKVIEVPKADDKIVIHEPEFGPKDASGREVLKPLEREETQFQPMILVAVAGVALLLLAVAWILGRSESGPPWIFLCVGAVVLAPPLAWGGYIFLRDDELLEHYTGGALVVRTALCSIGYAGLWGLFAFLYARMFGDQPVDSWNVLFLAPPILFLGAGIAYCSYDLDLGTGFFHYALYLMVTILLRLAMGLPAVGPRAVPVETPESAIDTLSMVVGALAYWL
jgi:predicted Zn finger-like uncharacterized protein